MKLANTIAAIAAVVSLSNCGSYPAPASQPVPPPHPRSAAYGQGGGGSQQSSFLNSLRDIQDSIGATRGVIGEGRALVGEGRRFGNDFDR